MKVNKVQNTLNFKAMKLQRKDSRLAGRLLCNYAKEPSSEISAKIVDIFSPYIEKEAVLKAGDKYSSSDFAQEMYFRLLSSIKTMNLEIRPVTTLIGTLNRMKPGKNEIISTSAKPLKELKEKEIIKDFVSEIKDESPREQISKLMQITPILKQKEKEVLNKYMDGYSPEELAQIYGVSRSRIREIKRTGILKMVLQLNSLEEGLKNKLF